MPRITPLVFHVVVCATRRRPTYLTDRYMANMANMADMALKFRFPRPRCLPESISRGSILHPDAVISCNACTLTPVSRPIIAVKYASALGDMSAVTVSYSILKFAPALISVLVLIGEGNCFNIFNYFGS